MNAKQLRQFIIKNKKDCALLIGNGINRYANSGCSWEILLKALASTYCPKLCFDNLPKTISNTEFFDLLEISIMQNTSVFDKEKFKTQNIPLVVSKETLEQINKEITELAKRPAFSLKQLDYQQLDKFKGFSTPDFQSKMEMTMTISSLGDKLSVALRSRLIAAICSYMKKWNFASVHKCVALFAQKYKLPILTTNYDNLFAKSVDAGMFDYGKNFSSESFPISCCFTNSKCPNSDEFGIWHINGMIQYPKSILIGLSHYMRSIEKVRSLIFPSNDYDAELFEGNHWGFVTLKDTWINLIFSRHLSILGLTLDKDEVLLRWLLLERAKYFALFPYNSKRSFYIVPESEDVDTGKELFLNNAGFEIVRVPDYDTVYKIVSNEV